MSEASGRARAWFVAARLDVRQLESREVLAVNPMVVRVGREGFGIAFRFGAACLVGATDEEERDFLASLGPLAQGRFESPEVEEVEIVIRPDEPERIDPSGRLSLNKLGVNRVQAVADVLAKSTVLAHLEERVGEVFDRVEALASELERGVRTKGRRDWLREIGGVLLTESQMVGRVEVTEKPESRGRSHAGQALRTARRGVRASRSRPRAVAKARSDLPFGRDLSGATAQ